MRPVGSAIELEKRRKNAVRRIRAGERVTDVAKDLGVSRVAVSKWKRAAIDGGLRALNAVPQHVPQSRMSSEQKRQLKKILIGGAMARGYPTDLWTCDRIAQVVLEEFGISYNPAHLGAATGIISSDASRKGTLRQNNEGGKRTVFRDAILGRRSLLSIRPNCGLRRLRFNLTRYVAQGTTTLIDAASM